MFLWASLVLNYLAANFFYDRDEFLTAIETLPQELAALCVVPIADPLPSTLDTNHTASMAALATRNFSLGFCPISTRAPFCASRPSLDG